MQNFVDLAIKQLLICDNFHQRFFKIIELKQNDEFNIVTRHRYRIPAVKV